MNETEIYNPFGDEEGLPANIPPAQAWNDMRARLESEMPAAGVPLPGNIVYAGNDFVRPVTTALVLLIIASFLWWFNVGGRGNAKVPDAGRGKLVNATSIAGVAQINKNSQDEIGTGAGANLQNHTAAVYAVVNNPSVHGRGKRMVHKRMLINGGTVYTQANRAAGGTAANPLVENYAGKITAGSGISKVGLLLNHVQSARKKDSAIEAVANIEKTEKTALVVQTGMLWNVQAPISGQENYFTGPAATPQPYRLLLAGGWLSVQADQYLLVAEVEPFATTVFNPKPFSENTTRVNPQSSLTQTKNLNKLFGLSTALRLGYNIGGNWWAGGGVQANFWQKGVVTYNNMLESNGNRTYYKTSGSLSDSDWAYFSKFQLRTDAELMYKASNWHAGLRLGIFFTPISINSGGQKSPLQVELFFRWKLLNVNKPKKHNLVSLKSG